MWLLHLFAALQLIWAQGTITLPFEAAFQGNCLSSSSPCDQLCRAFNDGTFECGCRDGFFLDKNGYSCRETNDTLLEEIEQENLQDDVFYERDATFTVHLDEADSKQNISHKNGARKTASQEIQKFAGTLLRPKSEFINGSLMKAVEGMNSLLEDGIGSNDINMIAEPNVRVSVDNENAVHFSHSSKVNHRRRKANSNENVGCHHAPCNHDTAISLTEKSRLGLPVLIGAHTHMRARFFIRPNFDVKNGILLLVSQKSDMAGDYLILMINDGYLELRFDCGSGEGVVKTSNRIKAEEWNLINVYRHRYEASIRLNHGPKAKGRSKGLFSRMTLREPLWIGSAGNSTQIREKFNLTRAFDGCIDHLTVNEHYYNLSQEAIVYDNVSNCSNVDASCKCENGGICLSDGKNESVSKCVCPVGWSGRHCQLQLDLNVPRFNGSSYLRLPVFYSYKHKNIFLKLWLKVEKPEGILIHLTSAISVPYNPKIILYLQDYQLKLFYEGKDGTLEVQSPRNILPNTWQVTCLNVSPKRLTLRLCEPNTVNCCNRFNNNHINKHDSTKNNHKSARDNHEIADDNHDSAKDNHDFNQLFEHNSVGDFGKIMEDGGKHWEFAAVNINLGGLMSNLEDFPVNVSYTGCMKDLEINGVKISIVPSALAGLNIQNCQISENGDVTKEIVPKYPPNSHSLNEMHLNIKPKKYHYNKKWHSEKNAIPHHKSHLTKRKPIKENNSSVPMNYQANIKVKRKNEKMSYIHIVDEQILNGLSSECIEINMRLKIAKSDASGEIFEAKTDDSYQKIHMANGVLIYSYLMQGDEVSILSNQTGLNDDKWHRLRAHRNATHAYWEVDGVKANTQKARFFKEKNRIGSSRGIYIGGTPSEIAGSRNDFHGCISHLELRANNEPNILLDKETCWK